MRERGLVHLIPGAGGAPDREEKIGCSCALGASGSALW